MFEDRSNFRPPPLPRPPRSAWGAMFPIAASALTHVDPFHLTAIRYGVAAVDLPRPAGRVRGPQALRTDGRGRELFVLGSLGFAGFNLLTYVALEHTRPQDAALIVAPQPLLTALGALADARAGADAARRSARWRVALLGVVLVITHGDPSHADPRRRPRGRPAGPRSASPASSPTRSARAASPTSRRCATRRSARPAAR